MNANDIQVLAPFGPLIAVGYLSQTIVDSLNEDFDKQIQEGGNDDHENLAGFLDIEKRASDEMYQPFMDEMFPLLSAYINACNSSGLKSKYTISTRSLWYNEYSGDDFNPLHAHAGSISTVFYLNSFTTTPRSEKYTRSTCTDTLPGATIFTHTRGSSLNSVTYPVEPEVGKVVVFPSELLHCVYPAEYVTPRRTGSANFNVELTDE